MKRIIILIVCVLIYSHFIAQNSNLDAIKKHYSLINRVSLIDTLFEKYIRSNKEIYLLADSLGFSVDILDRNKNLINILKNNSITILTPKFLNATRYDFSKDIYNHICIDSAKTEVRHYNIQQREVTILNQVGLYTVKYSKKEFRRQMELLNAVQEEKPEILLSNGGIFANNTNESTNYLFLKGEKIYVYRSKCKDIYELNHFVHVFFNEKKFKERAILNEKGLVLVGKNTQ